MLIRVPTHRPEDIEHWRELEREDRTWSWTAQLMERIDEAGAEVERFVRSGRAYVSTSWGKDSTVVAHLALSVAPQLPIVWVRVDPIANPHCHLVRDAFFQRCPAGRGNYHEIVVHCPRDNSGYHATGTLEGGLGQVRRRFGRRWIGGLRAAESGGRKRRIEKGLTLHYSCQPLGHWSDRDVFGYLHAFNLPVHPAYAMTMGGSLDRGKLRVASIGCQRGRAFGRREWEAVYYPAKLAEVEGRRA